LHDAGKFKVNVNGILFRTSGAALATCILIFVHDARHALRSSTLRR